MSNKGRYIDQEKRIKIKREILDWLLPIWTLPSVCEIRDKMQVVYKELTRDWIKSEVAKSQFSLKKPKRGRIAWKMYYQKHLVPC